MKNYGPQDDYHKSSMTCISVRFHNENDADVIGEIKSQPSQADYLRRLIRKDIEKRKESKSMEKRYTIWSTDNKGSDWENEWLRDSADTEEEAIAKADDMHYRSKEVYREKSSLFVVWHNHDGPDAEIVYVTNC